MALPFIGQSSSLASLDYSQSLDDARLYAAMSLCGLRTVDCLNDFHLRSDTGLDNLTALQFPLDHNEDVFHTVVVLIVVLTLRNDFVATSAM
jgi:hypothetical protein